MERAEPEIDLKVLSWLADCRRNGFLAVPLPGDVGLVLSASGQDWTRGLGCYEFDVEYEPRSIAVSPDGRRIAIGTKAGTIHQAVCTNGFWNPESTIRLIGSDNPAHARVGRAIRGLAFIGDRWLIAGRGRGVFTVIDLTDDSPPKDYGIERALERGKSEDGSSGDPWLLRFSGILPLLPGRQIPSGKHTALALGLTPSRFLHLLRRREDSFEVNRIQPEDLFGKGAPDEWKRDWLVDGKWWGDPGQERLWLLDSAGRIHRYRPGGDSLLGIEPDGDWSESVFEVPYLRLRPDPRSLSPCRAGLALRFGEDVTFVPYDGLRNGQMESPHWVSVPGAFRCLAVQEFDTADRAYLAVATSEAGLRWIPWQLKADAERKGPVFPDAQPQVFEGVVGSILEAALVHPDGVPYMVQGTRHHRMRIVSLLDKFVVDRHMQQGGNDLITASPLSALIDRFLETPRQPRTWDLSDFFLRAASPGVTLRVLQRIIKQEFRADAVTLAKLRSSPQRRKIAHLFGKLEMMDLFTVLRSLRAAWSAVAGKEAPAMVSRADIYRQFCLLIFQQAARLDEASLQTLARAAFDDIEESLRRDLSDDEWRDLASFSGFLRKWFIYGYTYGEKRLQLLELAAWNIGCGRNPDALFYITRVLRTRFDTRWERSIQPTGVSPGLWDMAAAPAEDPFFVHSHTDGRIFATDSAGNAITWEAARPEVDEIFEKGWISICDNGQGLQHSRAEGYRRFYRHGPYVRRLYLGSLEDDRFLLVFGIRGWHPTDFSSESHWRDPRLVVLEILWLPGEGEPENREESEGGPRLRICEAAICVTRSETYAITRIPPRTDEEREQYHLAIGTGGVWAEMDAPPGSRPMPLPFVELEVLRGAAAGIPDAARCPGPRTGGLSCILHAPEVEEDPRWHGFERLGEPPALLDQGPNPSWSADALEVRDEEGRSQVWLWIGVHDGRVRPFLWEAGRWLEGGRSTVAVNDGHPARPLLEPILAYSTVHELRCLQPPENPEDGSRQQPPLLAYGTADGVVGVLSLDRLVKASTPSEPWVHLVHSRQPTGIRGLADYVDGGHWNLAVLTEEGEVILYHLGHRDAPDQDRDGFMHRGLLLDQFKLSRPARALAATSWRDPGIWRSLGRQEQEIPGQDGGAPEESLPLLVVGGSDGTISCNALVMPRHSVRRSEDSLSLVVDLLNAELEPEPGSSLPGTFTRSVGRTAVHPWLRLCAVGQNNFLRFSIWFELRQLHESHLRKLGARFLYASEGPRRLATDYGRKLRSLANEVYGRQPFRPDGAQMLWAETAQYARKVAESSLEAREDQLEERLVAYNYLLLQIDHLCNRWIGADQALEAQVLIDSFSELFSWASLVLIARDVPELEEDLRETRKLLIFKVVQRRLRHDNIVVAFEAIRTINEALLRAIEKNSRRGDDRWVFSHRTSAGNSPGYYDLLALVGELVRQQAGRLTPSDPLYSEISKFFALSILLVPKSTLIVGQVVSESWLAERGVDVGLIQTSLHLSRLAEEIGPTGSAQQDTRLLIQRFDDYLSQEVDFGIDKIPFDRPLPDPGPEAHPWRRLIAMSWDPQAPPLTDAHYLSEQRRLLFTVARLARLSKTGKGTPDDELFAWLTADEELAYFPESKRYLHHLRGTRDRLVLLIGEDAPEDADKTALAICEEELVRLEDWPHLVEPQKSHYRQIIQRWREELGRRGSEARQLFAQASQLVELIDRFNRHVYRTSADDLMVSLLELALRSAPLAFPMPGEDKTELPLRLRVLERIAPFPFLTDLFQRGTLLVQRSHLAGVLLQLAHTHIRSQKSRGEGTLDVLELPEWNYKLESLWEKGAEIAGLEGVGWHCSPESLPPYIGSRPIPGNLLIWSTILQELARNIYAYCGTPGQRGRLRIRWSQIGEGREALWCLAIGGNRPFYDSMEPQYKDEVKGDPRALLERVKLIESNAGTRYGPERRGSFGFGLFFLMKLAGMLQDVKAGLLLIDPELNIDVRDGRLVQPGPDDFSSLSTSPLTMAFWWKLEKDDK